MPKPENLPEAREQSQAEIKSEQQECFEIVKRIERALGEGRNAAWELAEALYLFREHRGWLVLGYEKLNDWLAEPEVSMTYATFSRLVRVYTEFVVKRKLDIATLQNLDYAKADIVAGPLKRGEVLLEDALADVESLGARDLREKYTKQGEDEPETQTTVRDDGEPVQGEVVSSAEDAGKLDEALFEWHALLDWILLHADEEWTVNSGLAGLEKLVRAGVDPDAIMGNWRERG